MSLPILDTPFQTDADKPVPWNESPDNWAHDTVVVTTPFKSNNQPPYLIYLLLAAIIIKKLL